MAKWFYAIDGQQNGPVDPSVLKQLANSGRLKPSDRVRREDLQEWYQANQVKGLFAQPSPPTGNATPQATKTTAANVPPVATKSGTAIQKVPFSTVAVSSVERPSRRKRIASVAAIVGALFCLSLLYAAAHPGSAARLNQPPGTPATTPAVIDITKIDQNLNSLLGVVNVAEKNLRDTVEAVGGVDSGMVLQIIPTINAGQNFHNTFETQHFFFQLSLDTQRDWHVWRDAFVALQRKINADPNIISKLAGALSSQDPAVARQAAYALERQRDEASLAVPALIDSLHGTNKDAIFIACHILGDLKIKEAVEPLQDLLKSDTSYQRAVDGALSQINAPSAEELQAREAKVRAHEAELQQAQAAAMEATRKREEAEHAALAKKEAETRAKNEAEQKAATEANAQQAQVERQQLAEKLFGGISLEPKIQLSHSAHRAISAAELRGPDLARIKSLQEGKDWLGLVNSVPSNSYGVSTRSGMGPGMGAGIGSGIGTGMNPPADKASEYPENYLIEQAANQINNFKFVLFAKTNSKSIDVSQLLRVCIRDVDEDHYADIATWRSDWEKSPDGKGYFCSWSPVDGDVAFVFGKSQQLNELVERQTADLRQIRNSTAARIKLGEAKEQDSSDDFEAALKKARENLTKLILAL